MSFQSSSSARHGPQGVGAIGPPSPASSSSAVGSTVRLATRGDALGIAALYPVTPDQTSEDAVERARAQVAAPGFGRRHALFVATSGEQVVGYGRAAYVDRLDVPVGVRPPAGWYLLGLGVAPGSRRCGIGTNLTRARLGWLTVRTGEVYYFTRRSNVASIALHAALGFVPWCERFAWPRSGLRPGDGRLYRLELANS